MNHDETIKRIQELVPSVMALEFGCKINIGYDKDVFFVKMDDKSIYWIDNYRDNCEEDTIELQHLNFEILGKPITLAVVFQAIHATMCLRQQSYNKQESSKELVDYFATFEDDVYGPRWNLSKDNFNDQSEETKTFIGGLLNNK